MINIKETNDNPIKLTSFLYDRYIKLSTYLSIEDFNVLKKLNVTFKNEKYTEADIRTLKHELDKFYDIKWLQFKTRTPNEDTRLDYFEDANNLDEELFNEGYIYPPEPTKSLENLGVSREDFEKIFLKVETLERAIKIFSKLKNKRNILEEKHTLKDVYSLLMLLHKEQLQELL